MANRCSPNLVASLDADLTGTWFDTWGCCHCVSETRWCFPIMDTVHEKAAEFVLGLL